MPNLSTTTLSGHYRIDFLPGILPGQERKTNFQLLSSANGISTDTPQGSLHEIQSWLEQDLNQLRLAISERNRYVCSGKISVTTVNMDDDNPDPKSTVFSINNVADLIAFNEFINKFHTLTSGYAAPQPQEINDDIKTPLLYSQQPKAKEESSSCCSAIRSLLKLS